MLSKEHWIDAGDGVLYKGKIPTSIGITVGKESPIPHSGMMIAKQGDDNYEDMLDSYMFRQGYIRGDKWDGPEPE